MILAELELFHSRPIAPTRRVALGDTMLPCDPPPGWGGILLAGVVCRNARALDEDLLPDLSRLMRDLEEGRRIAQPRLRYRFQTDRVGLLRSTLRLVRDADGVDFRFGDERSMPAQRVLAAVYAAGGLAPTPRRIVLDHIRRGLRWQGPVGPAFVAAMADGRLHSLLATDDPVAWALELLGLGPDGSMSDTPGRGEIRRRFRSLLRDAHPDHGGAEGQAAERIAELREARRILLG